MDLSGKWKYTEQYSYGIAEGELYLKQQGEKLSGKIVFTDKLERESPYMIQEFLVGRIEGRKVKLEAKEFDIIHADFKVSYELDSWFGILLEDTLIRGVSVDGQGVEGYFEFQKMVLPPDR